MSHALVQWNSVTVCLLQVRPACSQICEENQRDRDEDAGTGAADQQREAAGGAGGVCSRRSVRLCNTLQADLLRPDPEDDTHVLGLEQVAPVFCNRFYLLFLMAFQHMNNRLLRMLKRKLIKGQQQEARDV